MKFKVEITETLQRVVEVEAESKDEAVGIVHDKYRNEEIVLDESDFMGGDITIFEDE